MGGSKNYNRGSSSSSVRVNVGTLAKAISSAKPKMDSKEAREISHYVLNFFGYGNETVDNILERDDRDLFYMLEDAGILDTKSCRETIYDGRKWRILRWVLKEDRIDELVNNGGLCSISDDKLETMDKIAEGIRKGVDTKGFLEKTYSNLNHFESAIEKMKEKEVLTEFKDNGDIYYKLTSKYFHLFSYTVSDFLDEPSFDFLDNEEEIDRLIGELSNFELSKNELVNLVKSGELPLYSESERERMFEDILQDITETYPNQIKDIRKEIGNNLYLLTDDQASKVREMEEYVRTAEKEGKFCMRDSFESIRREVDLKSEDYLSMMKEMKGALSKYEKAVSLGNDVLENLVCDYDK